MYLDVAQAEQLVELDVVREDKSLPISWNLRITQVDCRSTLGFPFSSGLRAPEGCLQYHYDRPRGAVTSFNFDLISPIAPGQNYAICFRHVRNRITTYAQQFKNFLSKYLPQILSHLFLESFSFRKLG